MKKIKINFEIDENNSSISFIFPDNLTKEQKLIMSEKTALFLSNLQTGNLMSDILHSIVEGGIISDDKNFSDLIIKKLLQFFIVVSDEKPIVTPSEAFVFKEKQ